MRIVAIITTTVILLSSCTTQHPISATNTPVTVLFTQTPVFVTSTSKPSPTPDLKGWETPPAEVLLLYDPTTPHALFPPAAKVTETVAKRKFQLTHPLEFRFFDTSHGSLMENKEKNILISLELLDHGGKANTAGFMSIVLDGKMHQAAGTPQPYNLSGFESWIIEIQSPAIYDNSIGQLIMVDIDSSNLFYAIGLAKPDQWESNGKSTFMEIINSVTFSGFN